MTVQDLISQATLWFFAILLRVHDFVKIQLTQHERPLVPGVRVEHFEIPSREAGRTIAAIRYTPEGAQGALPTHVSWQASGWVLKRLGLDRCMHSTLAKRLNATVIDAAYRKGPWYKYPAAQEDCEDAVAYVFANPAKYDTSRVTLGGSSAGGCMALTTAMSFGPSKIKGVFSLYPVTHIVPSSDMDSKKQQNPKFYSGIVIPSAVMGLFVRAYARRDERAELAQPRFSPYFGDVSKLPEHVLVACGDADTLYEDGRKMVEKIHREGSAGQKQHTAFLSIPNEAHEFNNFPSPPNSFEWRDKLYDAAVATLRASWGSP